MSQALAARVLSLVGFVVLARLLSPRDYGVAALAQVFIALLAVLAAGGLTQALVQRPRVDKLDLDSVFWCAAAAGTVLALGLFLASWPLAAALDEPQLGPVLRVLSGSLVFVGFSSTPQAVLMRDLRFKTNAQTTIAANVVATIVGVTFAFLGFGVWSLVIQSLLGIGVNATATLVLSGFRPSLRVSAQRAGSFFNVSRHIVGTSLLQFLNLRGDAFLIGAVIGPVALGIYTVAFRVIEIMNEVLATTTRQVAYPVFARIQEDRARLTRAYTSATRMCALLATPASLFLLVTAPEVVPLVFGEQWKPSVPVMQILCLIAPLYAVMQFNVSVLQSVGRVRTVFWLAVGNTVLQLIAFAIAVPYGIEWVAASLVIGYYLTSPVGLIIASRELEGSIRAHLANLVAPVVCSILSTGAVFAVRNALADQVNPWLLLVLLGVTGLTTYGVALRLFGRDVLLEARGYLVALLSGQPGPIRQRLAGG